MANAILEFGANEHAAFVRSALAGDERIRASMDDVTIASWQRCHVRYGLDPDKAPEPVVVARGDLLERQERSRRLLEIARHEMTNLYQQLAGSGHAIMLTDSDGILLNYIGDPLFTDTAARVGFQTGAVWNEAVQGTNAMGTCLVEQKPLVIHKSAHYFKRNALLTCAAAPILDPHGNVLAILDASSEAQLAQQHTMVLLNMSAQMIENRVFFCALKDAYVFRCHSRAEFIGTLGEGLIAFTPDGLILAANRSAIFQMALETPQQLVGQRIDELFTIALPMLLKRAHSQGHPAFPIHETQSERRFFAKVQPPENVSPPARAPMPRPAANPTVAACTDRYSPFAALHFGDPKMRRNLEIIEKVLDRDIPCMLFGETGVGKDVFARAMHQASARRDKPFVALNCASLPESLIESELFGYKAGAFTGASREGSRGKIVQADGGTLFLDEIGDMPIHLQARLLRVLEDRTVVPLGGDKAIPVSIQLISATHRDVRALIAEGKFREDLYYRIHGISLVIPPLRERADRRELILKVAQEEARSDVPLEWAPAALDRLVNYTWPGNLRQLRNVLRAVTALCEDNRISLRDIPEELRYAARVQEPSEFAASATFNVLDFAERDALLRALEGTHWNVSLVAKNLRLSRNTLYRRMKRYGISPAR
ncbi:sigma-54-dependent Fis family transcriptional regulator [Thiocapsa rosea]|uniref:Transcriptional regulator of acetoin/glycerol metabolism n=1 Tax=Thiocapsa rosea TaxID=69360 RepID=A0A495VCR4_9GAMM|nr:sigma-54-dependent Fis family transcriptional regulator [Thiocapsa rosea]RKT47129.1 transcriptional regulator of acetoin/glycerol metabolism [Thiocapsa rosea]